MKKFYKKLSIAIASLGLLLQLSTASAAIITFEYTDTVAVGEEFTVNVLTDVGSDELLSFGFDLSSLTNNVSFVSATINSVFTEVFLKDVSGLFFDPLDPFAFGPTGSVQLATLTFSADAVGIDTISLFGNGSNGGLFTFFAEADIDASFDITVQDVSAPATLGLFAIAGLGLLSLRRKP